MTTDSPIHMDPDGSIWFYDHTRTGRYGPYKTPQEAEAAFNDYLAWLHRPKEGQPKANLDTAVAEYVALREAKKRLEDEHAEALKTITDQMDRVEAFFLDELNTSGLESFKTPHGTVYSQTRMMASVADKGALFDWVRSTGNVEMLQGRVSNDVLKSWAAEHGGQLPPGVKVVNERKAYVRRS